MPQDKLEMAIQAVIEANHYSKEEEIKFRKFMAELVEAYNEMNNKTPVAATSFENNESSPKTM